MQRSVVGIILNYQRPEDTIACVESLRNSTYPINQVFILDNGSADDSVERLAQFLCTEQLLVSEQNLGFTGGINFLFQKALDLNPDYILSINNDTIVDPDFLLYLVTALEDNQQAGAACGTIYCHHDPNRVWYGGGRMSYMRGLAVHLQQGELLDPKMLSKESCQVTFITGCITLYRAEVVSRLGKLDDRFFMYLDDIEISARLLRHGSSLLYVPKSVIYHKVFGEKENPFKLYYSVRNRLLLIREVVTGWKKTVAIGYFLTVIIFKLVIWRINNPRFYNAAFDGLMDYFSGKFYEGRGFDYFEVKE